MQYILIQIVYEVQYVVGSSSWWHQFYSFGRSSFICREGQNQRVPSDSKASIGGPASRNASPLHLPLPGTTSETTTIQYYVSYKYTSIIVWTFSSSSLYTHETIVTSRRVTPAGLAVKCQVFTLFEFLRLHLFLSIAARPGKRR